MSINQPGIIAERAKFVPFPFPMSENKGMLRNLPQGKPSLRQFQNEGIVMPSCRRKEWRAVAYTTLSHITRYSGVMSMEENKQAEGLLSRELGEF